MDDAHASIMEDHRKSRLPATPVHPSSHFTKMSQRALVAGYYRLAQRHDLQETAKLRVKTWHPKTNVIDIRLM
jgi:hypothetical protein